VSTPTVLAWRNRYDAGGIDVLGDLERSSRPAVVDEVAIVVRTVSDDGRPPAPLGVTHWSARLLAEQLRREGAPVSFATISRIWRKWGPQPHRSETFKFSTDPRWKPRSTPRPTAPG
jgi:hypothetical protein